MPVINLEQTVVNRVEAVYFDGTNENEVAHFLGAIVYPGNGKRRFWVEEKDGVAGHEVPVTVGDYVYRVNGGKAQAKGLGYFEQEFGMVR